MRRRKRRARKTISDDLWVHEIFSRLPMKIIGQLNCVCKEWKSLISSQFCISLLHQFASSSSTPPNSQTFLLPYHPRYALYLPYQDEHLSGEDFRTSELPGEISLFHVRNSHEECRQMTRLIKFADMVSVLLSSDMARCTDLWVMEKHGEWTKLFNLSVRLYFNNVVMLSEDGYVFGPSLDMLASYDPNELGVKMLYRPLNAHVYEPSMFLMEVCGNSYAKDEVVDIQIYNLQADTTMINMWICPPVNWIKLNVCGIFKGEEHPAGAGGIFRDHEGKFIGAFSLKMKGESAVKTLAKGLRTGLLLARKMGIQSLIVELDEGKVVQPLTTLSLDARTYLGCLMLWECKNLIKGNKSGPGWRAGVCHTPRQLNKVADWLAKTGMNQDAECVVLDVIPYEIQQLIACGM